MKKYIEDAAYEMECIEESASRTYDTITQMVNDMFPRTNKKGYSKREIHQWKEILSRYEMRTEREAICRALELMTGKAHDYRCIRGCCQSDWQYIFYPADDYTDEAILRFEIEYFNTGTEWEIHDGETEPESAEDIIGYFMYCYECVEDNIRKEIAEFSEVKPEDVVLYRFETYRNVPVYSAV